MYVCMYVCMYFTLAILKIFINLLLNKVFRSTWIIGNRSFWLVSNLYLLNGMFRHLLAVPPCPGCSIGGEYYPSLVDYLTICLSNWRILNICIRWIVHYLEERAIHIFNNPGNEMFDSQFFVTSAINPRRAVGN